MSFRLGDRTHEDVGRAAPKVARLHALTVAGLPVPAGVVLEQPRLTAEVAAALAPLLARGPVIVRSAHGEEDGEGTSWAGIGLSVAGCDRIERVEAAIDEIRAHASALRRDGYRDDEGSPQILVQSQIERAWLLVCVWTPQGRWYVEAHDAPGDVLGAGATPTFAGPLEAWEHTARGEVTRVCEAVRVQMHGPHGLDLEIVVDPENAAWLVQARPLTAPLHPGWDAFSRAMADQPEPVSLEGLLTFDGEHNPAPLSPAHTWLMGWLRRERPTAGDPVVLAGWLYVRVLPRAIGRPDRDVDVCATLGRLRDAHLPRMAQALAKLRADLETTSLADLERALDRALASFLEMIDCYLGELVPARRAHAGPRLADLDAPLTLRDRTPYLDVLPAAWDVASPTLADLIPAGDPDPATAPAQIPSDPAAAATLLAEWDDHLFALGLAPLRAVYVRAAALLELELERVFLLTPDELRRLARGLPLESLRELMRAREQAARAQARLRPPLRLWDGRPVPAAAGSWLRGVPIGDPFTGVLAIRRDLEDLIARPPARGDVACLPALTAQAAVAVDRLGVRAICTEYGGALSHGALMARELGLSALVGCRGCTTLADRSLAHLDTRTGRLVSLASRSPARD